MTFHFELHVHVSNTKLFQVKIFVPSFPFLYAVCTLKQLLLCRTILLHIHTEKEEDERSTRSLLVILVKRRKGLYNKFSKQKIAIL